MNAITNNTVIFEPKFRPGSRVWFVEDYTSLQRIHISTVTLYQYGNQEAIQYNATVNGKQRNIKETDNNLFEHLDEGIAKLKGNIEEDRLWREQRDREFEERQNKKEEIARGL